MNALVDWFRDSGFANLAAFVGAVAALVASLWATVVSRRANARSHGIQARLLRIEEQRETDRLGQTRRAALRAEMPQNERGSWRLYVTNDGLAEARNVRVTMDGKPFTEHGAFVEGDEIGNVIGPGGENSCSLAIDRRCSPPFDLELNWEDDSGTPGRYRTTLTF